ncbi:MAG: NUDIX hydrolase [Dehalococcoidia bacterium]
MVEETSSEGAPGAGRALVGLSAAVYAQRDGKILLLKRAMGEVTGGWYLPGGAVDPGEDLEDAARRELFEESGLAVSGPLTLVGLARMHVYGYDTLQACYVCDCPDGEVVLSEEHDGARWMDPLEYRERYFGEAFIAGVEGQNARIAAIMRAVRDSLDAYLGWRDHQLLDQQLRVLGLTADMFVARGGDVLLLKRRGGIGDGVWYLPGGVVEPGEDPAEAAVRETFEECGLRTASPRLLRVWSYPAQNSRDAYHATYIAEAPEGDVVLSNEHSAHRWMSPRTYAERYCGAEAEAQAPQWARWLAQVRRNCALASEVIEGLRQSS